MAAVLKSVDPNIRVVGCQPAASNVMQASVAAGRILDQPSSETLSDGSAGGVVSNEHDNLLSSRPCLAAPQEFCVFCVPEHWRKHSGTMCAQEPGSITLEPCTRFVDDWVTVSEPEIAAAMLGIRDHHDGMLLEGMGANRQLRARDVSPALLASWQARHCNYKMLRLI